MKILIADAYEAPDSFCSDRCSPVFTKYAIGSVIQDEKSVSIWRPNDALEERISLIGHKRKINAFAVSPKSKRLLCTCSEDKIILWNLTSNENNDTTKQDFSTTGVTFAFDTGYIEYCSFSWDDKWLALCRDKEVLIVKIKWSDGTSKDLEVEHHCTLDTYSSSGNLCAFSSLTGNIIVTVEVNCYFKVWNLLEMTILYKSQKLGMHTVNFCSFAHDPAYLLLGTSGGTIHVYSFNDNNIPISLINVDVGKAFQNYDRVSKSEVYDYSSGRKPSQEFLDQNEECGELGCVIYGVYLFKRAKSSKVNSEDVELESNVVSDFFTDTDNTLKAILSPSPIITVCCNLGIAFYNSNSWDCEAILKTFDMFPPLTLSPRALPLLSFLVIDGETIDNLSCILKMAFSESQVRVLKLQAIEDTDVASKGADILQPIKIKENKTSIVPLVPVHKSSPLRYQMTQPLNTNVNPYASSIVSSSHKIKSSGYGKAPRTQFFHPVINKPKNANPRLSMVNKRIVPPTRSLTQCTREVGRQCFAESGPPINAGKRFTLWNTSGTVMKLNASSDGEHLACGSSATYIYILKFSQLDPEKGFNLFGHSGATNSLHFSMNSQWLVSASSDATAKVWDWRQRTSILDINSDGDKKKSTSLLRKEAVKNSVLRARFYYMDQFILTATQDCLELHSHLLHEMDLEQKNKELSKSKRIWKMKVPAQQITTFSAANQFHSYLVLCCCSNRSMQVFDLNADKCVVEISDIHSRPAHHLKQMEGSQAVSHSPAMYNLFLTASVCDSVKLWDLRSAKCIQKYCQHMNRAYNSGIDISPCGCYIAVSSEDKHIYLYDTRKCGTYIHKLGGLGDIVIDVAFNPRKPVLAAAGLNGCVNSYTAI